MRRYLFAAVLVAAIALAACGRGDSQQTASPEHLGSWFASQHGVLYVVKVSGEPGAYVAKFTSEDDTYGKATATFTGGYVDAGGNVVFDKWHSISLTLGPVSGETMTAYQGDENGTLEIEMER